MKIIRNKSWGKVVLLLCLLSCGTRCLATASGSQPLQNIPINGFILPVFNGEGQEIWEARGSSATMIEDNLLHVKNMKLRCFTEEEPPQEAFFAISDMAFVVPQTNSISENFEIKIFGQNFYASARTWEFSGNEKKIIAKDHVKVFLDCNLEECSP
ncbi:MAG: hypothetical protein LBD34_03165 [Puniceicoccales bacterium]|jgi:hypothetical protein|nr:hypothetical protein [Puniceicoccales bacterium]